MARVWIRHCSVFFLEPEPYQSVAVLRHHFGHLLRSAGSRSVRIGLPSHEHQSHRPHDQSAERRCSNWVSKQEFLLAFREFFDVAKYEYECDVCETSVKESSKHCGRCNRCTEKFDHHCDWLNNCIGKANYLTFFYCCIVTLAMCTMHLVVDLVLLRAAE